MRWRRASAAWIGETTPDAFGAGLRHANRDVDATDLVVAAGHHLGVLVEPVQPLAVGGFERRVRSGDGRAPAALRSRPSRRSTPSPGQAPKRPAAAPSPAAAACVERRAMRRRRAGRPCSRPRSVLSAACAIARARPGSSRHVLGLRVGIVVGHVAHVQDRRRPRALPRAWRGKPRSAWSADRR